jgi:two-component system, response regulator
MSMSAAHSDKPILLVEDNPSDEELTLRALQKSNILNPVTVARDGVEALDYLLGRGKHAAAPPPLPSVVLLDLKLPKINGLEVLRALRSEQRTRLLPVVVLSSSNEERDLLASYELGANSYVRKPVDFGQFLDAARQLGQYWLSVNQSPPEAGR